MEEAQWGTVLVTGGAGFIGSALSQRAAERASRWVVVDNLHPQVHPNRVRPEALHESAEFFDSDVTDAAAWDLLLKTVRPEVVVHLAAETGTGQSLSEATRHAAVNVVGTTEMLDAFTRVGHVPRHFVLSSSRAVYGEGQWRRLDTGEEFVPGPRSHAQLSAGQWDAESAEPLPSEARRTWPTPTSVYGATKLAQENVLSSWASAHDARLSILRFQNVFGPGQSLTNPYTGIVSLFSQLAMRGESIPVYEDGLITRDFVYIDDVVASIDAAMSGTAGVGPFDIGSGRGTTILELAQFIAEYHAAPAPTVTGAFREGDVRHAAADISRSGEELGWAPSWSVEQGIRALQEWIAGRA